MDTRSGFFVAYYDLAHGPVSYDFVTFLVQAKMRAAGRKLHIVIVSNDNGLGGFARHWGAHDAEETRFRLWSIVIGCCPLAGASVTLAPSRDFVDDGAAPFADGFWYPDGKAHLPGALIDAARAGQTIPLLEPTVQARRYVQSWIGARPLVTVTIRDQQTDAFRNSDSDTARFMRDYLLKLGYNVILLADSHKALLHGHAIPANICPDLRLALYERAHMNIIGNNGPAMLLWHSKAPFLMFNAPGAGHPYRQHWTENLHLEPGDQLPWAHERQRLIYAPDSVENVVAEFDRLLTDASCTAQSA